VLSCRITKGAFTRVPQVDQRGWINQSEPCKHLLSTELINGVDGWTSWAKANFCSTSLIHFGWLTDSSRFQNGGKWTCARRCCCNVWLFNERMSTHFRKMKGKKTTLVVYIHTLPSRTRSCGAFWNRLPRSLLWNRVNSIVQPLNSVEFNFTDSTALINREDPCKRSLRFQAEYKGFFTVNWRVPRSLVALSA
jgi:hypothetical protein